MPDLFVSPNPPVEEHPTAQGMLPKTGSTPKETPPGKPMPFFGAYCHMPQGISFMNQEPNEQIILFLRKHFITNLNWIGLSFILLALPLFLPLAADYFADYYNLIPVPFVVVLIGFYYLIVFGFIYLQFITWFYNVGIVTNRQLIDIDFSDIMYRDIAKVRIENVIDVEFMQGGILDAFFDFGNVNIQTEGIKPNFELEEIPHPDKASDIILELKERARHE